ncbi:hypothetical protein EYC59_05105 [Candidatus Saccharibacteria bacterium]|nr:MAG: hypothetical protein EYC59_05105 [Candidatus Saccharibacteria bacterium]
MTETNRKYLGVRVYFGALAALLTYTLIAQCILTHHEGRSIVNTFSYFTIQSNVLVLVTSAILAVAPAVAGAWWRLLRLAAVVGITVTGIVYSLILAKYVHLSGAALLYTHIFHYISPLATILGFLFIEPRLRLRWRDMAFMVWPVAWLVYTMVRGAVAHPEFTGFGETPSHYPYGFLDVDKVPLSEVTLAIVIIATLLSAIGAAYIWLDRRRSHNRPDSKREALREQ